VYLFLKISALFMPFLTPLV